MFAPSTVPTENSLSPRKTQRGKATIEIRIVSRKRAKFAKFGESLSKSFERIVSFAFKLGVFAPWRENLPNPWLTFPPTAL
jgi:hypothetical protein